MRIDKVEKDGRVITSYCSNCLEPKYLGEYGNCKKCGHNKSYPSYDYRGKEMREGT